MDEKMQPLGIVPRSHWERRVLVSIIQERAGELKGAIGRYLEADIAIHPEWVAEYNEHLEKLKAMTA